VAAEQVQEFCLKIALIMVLILIANIASIPKLGYGCKVPHLRRSFLC